MKLDAPYGCPKAELKTNFRKLAKVCHPDHCSDKVWATKEFRELVADYQLRLKRTEIRPKPKPVIKTQRLTAAVGYSCYIQDGVTIIDADINEGFNRLDLILHGKNVKPLGLQMTEGGFFVFSVPIPSTFDDGDMVTIRNLPFKCKVKLFHKKK